MEEIINRQTQWMRERIREQDSGEDNFNDDYEEMDAEDLIRATRKMCKSAGGPDAWRAQDLIRRPKVWWDALARLWNVIVHIGIIPCIWVKVRLDTIPKASGGFRPIAVATIAWRAGARVLARRC